MITTDEFKLASVGAQAKLRVVTGVLASILGNIKPNISLMAADTHLAPLANALQFFIRETVVGKAKEGSTKAPTKTVFGGQALHVLFDRITAKRAEQQCTSNEVKHLKIFAHLLPSEIAADAASLVQQIEEQTGITIGSANSQPSAGAATGSQSGAVAEAMSMFT